MDLNPLHPEANILRDQWHKIAAAVVASLGDGHAVITVEDVKRLEGKCVVAQGMDDGLHLYLVDMATAERLAREQLGRLN